ncbi:MAG: ROK family protein [Bacillota bacterium]
MGETYILGLDIGGTSIKAGLVNQNGDIKDVQIIPTNSAQGPKHVLGTVANLITYYQEHEFIKGIGIALAGSINSKSGACIYSPNLNWTGIEIGRIIGEAAGTEVRIINDASAACLGEYHFGAGCGYKNIVCITIGTGIGSGVILDNKLFIGTSGLAPEAGHMIIVKDGPLCPCGSRGCWEALVSATAIVKKAVEQRNASTDTVLDNYSRGEPDSLTIKEIFKAWQENDYLVVEIINDVQEYLAIGLANLINILNPQCIILGGGVMDLHNEFTIGLEEKVSKYVFPSLKDSVIIKKAKLGNNAGLIGGASLFLKEIGTIGG